MLSGDPTLPLRHAHGGAVLRGVLRASPEDFVVEEQLGYQASGDGEHDFLRVWKRGRNTHDVARELARHAGVPHVAVGYAGLKDRHAVTTQHFSVQLPGRASPDWSLLNDESMRVLTVERHNRKIRRGSLRGNCFVITVRDVRGDRDLADQRMRQIGESGAPNYFGSQRFGREGSNLSGADALFAGRGRRPKRELRGMLLSAARSHLFNLVLDARVAEGNWSRAIDGDVLMLAGSQRQFPFSADDATIPARVAENDVHPSGPLCGRESRALTPGGEAAAIENRVLDAWVEWRDGLQRFGLDAERRALRLIVDELSWDWIGDTLRLHFTLPAGAYATSAMRELLGAGE